MKTRKERRALKKAKLSFKSKMRAKFPDFSVRKHAMTGYREAHSQF